MPHWTTWDVRFTGSGAGFGGDPPSFLNASLALLATAGPERVRVQWGSTGPFEGLPATQIFRPLADGSGEFRMPLPDDFRSYPPDGAFIIRVSALIGSEVVAYERLDVFFALNDDAGILRGGGARDDMMIGGSGNDTFRGNAGDDWLAGAEGDDLVRGGAGNDVLFGDLGADTLHGDDGDDFLGAGDGDDSLRGGAGNDGLFGDQGNDTARGGEGDDFVFGGEGNDSLLGDDGNDWISGEAGNDSLRGGAGDDRLDGGADNDRLDGGLGSDWLIGGRGGDIIAGLADGFADYVVYLNPSEEGGDRIVGFEAGIDRIVFELLAPVGSERFLSSRSEMFDTGTYVIYDPTTGRLDLDLNGTAAGGFVHLATFIDLPALAHSDFMFFG